MKQIHVLGRKNHGKTTLIADLTGYWTAQGLRVGTIKHTHHAHELDTPGKDSHRHRMAGACTVGILSPKLNAVYWAPADSPSDATDERDRYAVFAPHFQNCDLVLVEGDTQAAGLKIEVWRAAVGGAPLAAADAGILAVVTDDDVDVGAQKWPRKDAAALADMLRNLVASGHEERAP